MGRRDDKEIRIENNPIEDVLWWWTLGKLALKILALVLFGVYVLVKVLCK